MILACLKKQLEFTLLCSHINFFVLQCQTDKYIRAEMNKVEVISGLKKGLGQELRLVKDLDLDWSSSSEDFRLNLNHE